MDTPERTSKDRTPISVNFAFPTETALRTAVAGLLSRMPGTQGVQTTHGPQEYGKDLVFYSLGPLGDPVLCACIVTNSAIKGTVNESSSARSLFHQAEQALDVPHIDGAGNAVRIVRVFVMSPFDVTQSAMSSISRSLQQRSGQIEFIVGTKLFELFTRYWPEFIVSGTRSDARLSPDKPAKIFLAYSHKDEGSRDAFYSHLSLLIREGLIELLPALSLNGETSSSEITDLELADIILLLISSDFLASEFCYDVLLPRALARHEGGRARVIPILIRETAWDKTPLSRLQALPRDAKPVNAWRDQDVAWSQVAEGIRAAIYQMRGAKRPKKTLRISHIEIQNIRCFSKVRIDLHNSNFAMLFGDNGLGKSTILRCIALGLCSEGKGSALLHSLTGEFIRNKQRSATITLELYDAIGKKWLSRTVLRRARDNSRVQSGSVPGLAEDIVVARETDADFPQESVFATGYGAGRRSMAVSDPASEYMIDSAVRTLFDYTIPLQNPELIFRRLAANGKPTRELMLKLDAALSLEAGSTTLDSSGIRIQGPWGSFVPVGALGDGYQATLGWISDFFGHQALFDKDCPFSEMSGIVLIDELEQHLHPRWQRDIVQTLNQQFPDLQFIATSHSPICAGGLADIPEKNDPRLFVLKGVEGHTSLTETDIPAGMRYDEIITSPVIGLEAARDKTTSGLFEELHRTFARPGDTADQSPAFDNVIRAIGARSSTAAEDAHMQALQQHIDSTAQEVDEAVRDAKNKKQKRKSRKRK